MASSAGLHGRSAGRLSAAEAPGAPRQPSGRHRQLVRAMAFCHWLSDRRRERDRTADGIRVAAAATGGTPATKSIPGADPLRIQSANPSAGALAGEYRRVE